MTGEPEGDLKNGSLQIVLQQVFRLTAQTAEARARTAERRPACVNEAVRVMSGECVAIVAGSRHLRPAQLSRKTICSGGSVRVKVWPLRVTNVSNAVA